MGNWSETIEERPFSIIGYVILNVLLVYAIGGLFISCVAYYYSRSACLEALEYDLKTNVVVESLGMRVQDKKWTFGYVLQPKRIDMGEYTKLCVLSEPGPNEILKDIVVNSYDIYDENVADKHKLVTVWWLNPKVWRYVPLSGE